MTVYTGSRHIRFSLDALTECYASIGEGILRKVSSFISDPADCVPTDTLCDLIENVCFNEDVPESFLIAWSDGGSWVSGDTAQFGNAGLSFIDEFSESLISLAGRLCGDMTTLCELEKLVIVARRATLPSVASRIAQMTKECISAENGIPA